MRRFGLRVLVVIVVVVAAGCDGRTSPGDDTDAHVGIDDVIAAVDAVDDSCDDLEDPIRLVDVFVARRQWFVTTPAALVALETGREAEPQRRVIVEGLAGAATQLDEFKGLAKRPVLLREDRFDAAGVTADVGGNLDVQVYDVDGVRSGAKALVWFDPDGAAHFFGDCAARLWTEPFAQFAEAVGRSDDHEMLLRELISEGRALAQLTVWSNGGSVVPVAGLPLEQLELPSRTGDPDFVVAILQHRILTFVTSRGESIEVRLPPGIRSWRGYGQPQWIDDDTLQFGKRLDADTFTLVNASLDGSVTVAGEAANPLPSWVGTDGVNLYQDRGGWAVGTPGALTEVAARQSLSPMAAIPGGGFLATDPGGFVRITASGDVEPYELPDFGFTEPAGGFARSATPSVAAFGPDGMVAFGLNDHRLVVALDEAFYHVADLPKRPIRLTWDRTGTALITYVSGEPPDPNAHWLVCDLLDGGTCQPFGPGPGYKDTEIVQPFTG